jgi:hypothetical protein
LNIVIRLQRQQIHLHHLADFFLQRHLRQQFIRLRFRPRPCPPAGQIQDHHRQKNQAAKTCRYRTISFR